MDELKEKEKVVAQCKISLQIIIDQIRKEQKKNLKKILCDRINQSWTDLYFLPFIFRKPVSWKLLLLEDHLQTLKQKSSRNAR